MLDRVEEIARELGTKLLSWRHQGLVEGRWEGTQFKAEADVLAHRFLTRELAKLTPAIPVISEEAPELHNPERPPRYWLIDPIDGTASFCGGFDGFVTQLALMDGRGPELGVVHAPALDLTYGATRSGSATCNGRPLGKSAINGRVLIDNYPEPQGIAREVYDELVFDSYIESGSLGLKICRVADGTADLFVKDVWIKDWDVAPAHLVLNCVGGSLKTLAGDRFSYAGGYDRLGLIATRSEQLARRVEQWRKRRQG